MVKSAHFPMFLYVSHIPIGHSHGGKVMCLLRFLTWGRALKGTCSQVAIVESEDTKNWINMSLSRRPGGCEEKF